jgi:hypothetical protein
MRLCALGSARLGRFETGLMQVFPIYGDEQLGKIACATMIAASLFLMSACTIAPYHSLESEALFAPENNISQLAANDSFNQCNEQTKLLKHVIALCRAVPLIKVPLQ